MLITRQIPKVEEEEEWYVVTGKPTRKHVGAMGKKLLPNEEVAWWKYSGKTKILWVYSLCSPILFLKNKLLKCIFHWWEGWQIHEHWEPTVFVSGCDDLKTTTVNNVWRGYKKNKKSNKYSEKARQVILCNTSGKELLLFTQKLCFLIWMARSSGNSQERFVYKSITINCDFFPTCIYFI